MLSDLLQRYIFTTYEYIKEDLKDEFGLFEIIQSFIGMLPILSLLFIKLLELQVRREFLRT